MPHTCWRQRAEDGCRGAGANDALQGVAVAASRHRGWTSVTSPVDLLLPWSRRCYTRCCGLLRAAPPTRRFLAPHLWRRRGGDGKRRAAYRTGGLYFTNTIFATIHDSVPHHALYCCCGGMTPVSTHAYSAASPPHRRTAWRRISAPSSENRCWLSLWQARHLRRALCAA